MCRIQRDVAMRGRDIAGVIEQYTKFVKPAFDTFVAPSRKHADVIIPWGRSAAPLDHYMPFMYSRQNRQSRSPHLQINCIILRNSQAGERNGLHERTIIGCVVVSCSLCEQAASV